MTERPPACGPTFRVETLGCKANLYDSQRIAESLAALGYREAPEGEPADLHLVNTCTVTLTADRKTRQLIRRAVRLSPGGRVFVTGCGATASAESFEEIEGVAGVFGRNRWNPMLRAIAGGEVPPEARLDGDFGITTFRHRARAFVKIQEGCDFFCAYCIVPHVRGKPRSRPLAEVERECRTLAVAGYREVVLTGIHLGLYGRDLADPAALPDAVRCAAGVPGIERVRLSSIEAFEVGAGLLEAMQRPGVCPHLHVPLQSGADGVLRRMGRRYDAAQFLAAVAQARRLLDNPAITTDVIVGFPGESDAEFERTMRVCREAAPSRMHIFPFSPRPGTAAAQMADGVPPQVVAERRGRLQELADTLAAGWARSFVGRVARVLFEDADEEGRLAGYTDRYVRLTARGGEELIGAVRQVRCVEARGACLEGEIPEPRLPVTATRQ